MVLAVETKKLTKFFGRSATVALDGVDLEVPAGEIFALLGPNGAGKTTLIKILCSLILPDSGEASVYGLNVVKNPAEVRSLLSLVVGEERSFYWRLTGRQNLEFFATLYNLPRKTARQRIEEAAFTLGLEDLEKRYQEYSTGMKQRLALARSLLHDAKLIFMDEPTRSLDPNAATKLRELMRSLSQGPALPGREANSQSLRSLKRTVFFTTHQIQEAQSLADRIAILDKGKIKACGTLKELQCRFNLTKASLEQIFQKATSEDS
ncbi:MAG: ABC transporter ATP-binding protein [Deltaproteobacteria bacterium]|nr:ABC transporter ATP-binding protein [Deltaproteobacteria bacterium]